MGSISDLTGALIAEKYELLRLLGHGGMGAVYEARNVTTLKRCAVKVLLNRQLASDEEVVKRFFREARASGVIESEHVVAAFDSGIDAASHVYYVMECLQGEDLQQLLKRTGSLNPTAAAKIILQAASGLACAHALGIVHRDVKPANLFLAVGPGDEVKVKILDFGVAKVKMEIFHESSHSLTRTGSMLGTPLYMSPEQMKRASDIDESADVWSLGVVLFEAVSGKLPWGNVESVGELMAAILTLKLPPLQQYASWVSPDLAQIVHATLSRDSNHRMRHASELRDALRALIPGDVRLYRHELVAATEEERALAAERLSLADTLTMPPGISSANPVVASIPPKPPTSRRGMSLTAIAGVAAIVGATGWTMMRRAPVVPPLQAHAATLQVASAIPSSIPIPVPIKRFTLQVGPSGVAVSVDGESTPVLAGSVAVYGHVGTAHRVVVSRGAQSRAELVAITEQGLIPASILLPVERSSEPTKPKLPKAKSSDGGLSVIFD